MSHRRTLPFVLTAAVLMAGIAGHTAPLHAAPVLDLGAEYRLRGIQYSNVTYASEPPLGSDTVTGRSYYSQRGRVYLKARLDSGIEIGSVLQAIGISGSTQSVVSRYPAENFTPFMENLYIQANEFHGWPISLTLGRQSYMWGSGLLLSDNGLGFDGIRMDVGPFWGIRTHFFTAKARDSVQSPGADSDVHLAGLSYAWGIHNIRFGYVAENDGSGSNYFNLRSSVPVASDRITRTYYDLQVSGRLEKGAFYKAEYAMQSGKAKIPGKEFALSGSALTFEGGFDFVHPRYKRMILAFVFMQGSGDKDSTDSEDEKFSPAFGHKFDGLERVGYGEFFAATPYSFFNEDKIIVKQPVGGKFITAPYVNLFSGLRMFGFRGSVNPWEPFTAGLEFYIFTARELPTGDSIGGIKNLNDNEIGRELVFSGSYQYAKRILFSIKWGKFFASTNLNNIGSSRLTVEAQARF